MAASRAADEFNCNECGWAIEQPSAIHLQKKAGDHLRWIRNM
jgi:hypothetical protein